MTAPAAILSRAMRLIWLYTKVSVQNVAAYRFEFFVRFFMSFLHLAAELMIVWTLYLNSPEICGWRWQHMLVLVGVFRMVAGGIRMTVVPNMRRVLEDIREGTLDFVLLRPVNSQFLVSIREFVVWRVMDVVLGFVAALYGCWQLEQSVSPVAVLRFFAMLTAAAVIVYSAWLILATLCFWFVRIQNIEMIFWNVFEAGKYPTVFYPHWVQWTFTYLIPLAFITTVPAATLFGREGEILTTRPLLLASGAAAGLFLLASWFWRFGLRRYSGASA